MLSAGLTLLGFFVGIGSLILIEYVKDSYQKSRLINLFIQDFETNWMRINEVGTMPEDTNYFSYHRLIFRELRITFTAPPDIYFELHNLSLFENAGLQLAQLLRGKARALFWNAYSLLRDAESARSVLKSLSKDAGDYNSYNKLFVQLSKEFYSQYNELYKALPDELPCLHKLISPRRVSS